jgi:hypothetical protein
MTIERALARGTGHVTRLVANRFLSVSTDPCQGDPGALALRTAASRGDWATARPLLAGVTDPNTRSFHLDVLADTPGAEKWLDQALRHDPADTLALLAHGHRMIRWAWAARGSGAAVTVSRSQSRTFFDRLAHAESILGEVAERTPADPDAWTGLITCNRGLQRGLDSAWQRFTGAVSANPGHLAAHRTMLQQLCAKWGGDDTVMRRFAVDTATSAPEGSPLTALVPEAHLEIWVGGAGQRHIREPEVTGEIREAAAWGAGNPAYRPFTGDAVVHNLFARAFVNAKLPAEAEPFFRAAGNRVVEQVWADAGYLLPAPLIGVSYQRERAKAVRAAAA